MTTFDERQRAFESRYVHDEELKFRVLARRNHKIGLWAARRLGHEGAEAESYAQALVDFSITGGGDAAVVERLVQAFDQAAVPMSREDILHQIASCTAQAQQEIHGA